MKKLGGLIFSMLFLLAACGGEQTVVLWDVEMSQKNAEVLETTQKANRDIAEQLAFIEQNKTADTELLFEKIDTVSQIFVHHLSELSENVDDDVELKRLEARISDIKKYTDEILSLQYNASVTYEEGLKCRYLYVNMLTSYLSSTLHQEDNEEILLAELTEDLNPLFGTEEIIANGELEVEKLEETLGDIFKIDFYYDGYRKNFNFTPVNTHLIEYIANISDYVNDGSTYWQEHVALLAQLSEQLAESVGPNCYIWYVDPNNPEEILLSFANGYALAEM